MLQIITQIYFSISILQKWQLNNSSAHYYARCWEGANQLYKIYSPQMQGEMRMKLIKKYKNISIKCL